MNYYYLHGFSSSPHSAKAKYFRDRFHTVNQPLELLDFNQNDFSHLTLTRQIEQVVGTLPSTSEPVTLIGSSFGGLTAVWAAEQCPQVERIILLAPAFGFPENWMHRLTRHQQKQWKDDGYFSVYHSGYGRELPLHFNFISDAKNYKLEDVQRNLPTLIIHGEQDEVIPCQSSRDYSQTRPWVQLITLASDHSLGNVISQIWQSIQQFCQL